MSIPEKSRGATAQDITAVLVRLSESSGDLWPATLDEYVEALSGVDAAALEAACRIAARDQGKRPDLPSPLELKRLCVEAAGEVRRARKSEFVRQVWR